MRKALAAAVLITTVAWLRGGTEGTRLTVQALEALIDGERFDAAREAIQNVLLTDPGVSEFHRVDGDLLFREGRISEAGSEYTAAIHADAKNALAIYGLARTLRVQGWRAKAAKLVRDAHALAPSNAEISRDFDELDVARQGHEWELASPYQHYDLPGRVLLQLGRVTGMALTISVNGVPAELRVDTGAGGVNLSSASAAKAGIQRTGTAKGWGIGSSGPAGAWIGHADELSIGGLQFKNVTVQVSDKGSIDASGGLIGTDIFRRFLVKLDFLNHRVQLDPLFGPAWDGNTPVDKYAGPETEGFSPVLQVYHYLLIPTVVSEQAKSDRTNALFLVDTGARFNNISTRLARSVTTVRKNHHMTIKGVSGKVDALYEAEHVVLQFAGFQQPTVDLAAFDLSNISRNAGLEIGGILGLPVLSQFRSITIDYRDEGIRFEYEGRSGP